MPLPLQSAIVLEMPMFMGSSVLSEGEDVCAEGSNTGHFLPFFQANLTPQLAESGPRPSLVPRQQ